MRIGYLTSEYPARSHTFIKREIDALRQHNLTIKPFSIRKCPEHELLNNSEYAEHKATWSIFPINPKDFLISHIKGLTTAPLLYLTALRNCFSHRTPGLKSLFYSIIYFTEAIHLAQELQNQKIEFLHIQFANAGVHVGSAAAAYLNIPWGLTLHGSTDFEFPGSAALPWAIAESNFIRCVSYYGASQAMRVCRPHNLDKIFVCYCGCPEINIPSPPASEISNDRIKIVSVGRLSSEKGQILLLKAAHHLTTLKINFELTLVGDGPDRQLLEAMAQELGIAENCNFAGSVSESEVFEWLSKADIFISPSLMEGLPQVLVEAMMMGLPVIAPCVAGIPELVEHNKNGLLYPPGHWQAMAESVARLHKNQPLVEKLTQGALKTVPNFYPAETIKPLVKRLESL